MISFRVLIGQIYSGLCWIFFAAALFLLPITSLPLISERLGGVVVAPPSAFLFLILAVIWLLPHFLCGGKIPVEGWPLLAFLAVVVVSWAFSLLVEVPSFRGHTPLIEGPQAFATLALGVASFFVPAVWLRNNQQRLQGALQIITLGGVALVLWSLVQAWFTFFLKSEFPLPMIQFQWLFSFRQGNPLIPERATGFAYEPSWLAHQLNIVYLPLWLAATLRGYSVFPRLWRISVENVLLLGGVFVLFVSFSRIGWLSFLAVLLFLTVLLIWRLAHYLAKRFFPAARSSVFMRLVLALVLLLLVLFAYVWIASEFVQFGARHEARLERILNRDVSQAQNIYEVFNYLEFAERTIYWSAGIRTFSHYWPFGVGIGNFGFYFPQLMPRFGWWLTEMTDLLNRYDIHPNVKNLWVRLLAETGLVGFAVFITWYVILSFSALLCWRDQRALIQTIGLTGLFMLTAFLVEGWNLDSFAMPYFWVIAGLLAATRSFSNTEKS